MADQIMTCYFSSPDTTEMQVGWFAATKLYSNLCLNPCVHVLIFLYPIFHIVVLVCLKIIKLLAPDIIEPSEFQYQLIKMLLNPSLPCQLKYWFLVVRHRSWTFLWIRVEMFSQPPFPNFIMKRNWKTKKWININWKSEKKFNVRGQLTLTQYWGWLWV